MAIQLKGQSAQTITDEIRFNSTSSLKKRWYNCKQPMMCNGFCNTINEFYDDFIAPRLPQKNVVENWIKVLLEYVEQEDSVYALRTFANWLSIDSHDQDENDLKICQEKYNGRGKAQTKGGKTYYVNPYTLRRGFLTKFTDEEFSYFFTDNFFATIFLKMAFDGFVPESDELKNALKNRILSARFGPSTKEERDRSGYDICGVLFKDPKIGHYVAHVLDTGKDFVDNTGAVMGMSEICDNFFPRGSYVDWKMIQWNNQPVIKSIPGLKYVRNMECRGGKEYLKAHFLRFTCPVNYFLTPLKKQQMRGNKGVWYSNVAELYQLQEYMIGKCYQQFGELYVDYLTACMWKSDKNDVKNELRRISGNLTALGKTVIDLSFSNGSSSATNSSPTKAKANPITKTTIAISEGVKVGQPVKNVGFLGASSMSLNLMNLSERQKLEKYVKSVGKSVFVEIMYPELLRNMYIDNIYLARKYGQYGSYSVNSQRSRLSTSKTIFRNGWQCAALEIISGSNSEPEARALAEKYLREAIASKS